MTAHFSPWAKIHLGWIEPVVVVRSARYTLPAVEQNPVAYVLYDPEHGVDEYYILENRWPQASQYESGLPDSGLAIWHITEFYDDEPFNFLRGRKMVRTPSPVHGTVQSAMAVTGILVKSLRSLSPVI